jgi:intein/homing endonuclease
MVSSKITRQLNEAWLMEYAREEPSYNPLDILRGDDDSEFEKKIAWLFSRPEFFSFTCKHIMNIELLPFQDVLLSEIWNRKFPMFVASRGAGKTWLLALYSLLRALILPNRKIMIAGASFRQSRFLHEYMEGIWKNAPILRDLCDVNSGPTRSPDVCTFVINNSTIKAIPIGTGDKIRGYRAHDLVVDEFACLVSSTIIQSDQGLIKLSDYLSGDAYDLINIDGELETPDQIFKTPKTDVYRIETDNGYSFSCSSIHQVMTKDGWKLAKDLTIEDHLPLDINSYFPDRILEKNGYVLDEKLAWLIGILISEGTVTNRNYIQITNTDKELIDKVLSEFSEFDWKIVEKEPYIDKRGFDCKRCWSIQYNDVDFRTALRDFGVSYDISLNKTVPSGILLSPKKIIASFLSGLFEGDGSAFYYDDKGKKRIGIAYYTSSKELADTLQILLLKFGITCSNVIKNSSELSDRKSYMLGLRGTNAAKAFDLLDIIKWRGKFDNAYLWKKKPTISVVTKKTTRYNLSTSVANKNKHLGSFGSREEAVAFFEEYIKTEKPLFRVRSVELLPEQEHLYDFHMPKTHTFIGNGFIQHNSHNREIFETVLAGFGNVAANTVDNVKRQSSIKEAKRLGINQDNLVDQNPLAISNQIIISGTAYYDFHFFADYWKKWKQIINSKGDPRKVAEIFKGDIPADFNWKDYSVIRLPYELIPKGFMDDANIARSRASVHSGIFDMEYSAIFCSDSKGFFKRSLIESCVASENNSLHLPSGLVVFDATLVGRKDCKYVIGVDPASEVDNFAVVIVEIHPDHRRVVHSWTINRHVHVERVKLGLVKEDNFYSYCARKIRDLMRLFPTERIMLDSQGGGVAVSEALHETSNLYENEVPIWQIIDEKKEKPSDDESGLHIIEMVNFASADWTSEANHGLRKDLEDKAILFPKFDPVILALAAEQDKANNKLYDTLEDCVTEIEELKNELVLIEITQTATGRDKWDTPELKTGSNKKGRMRKDRYSALIMANMGARSIKVAKDVDSCTYGGFSKRHEGKDKISAEYIGPAWFVDAVRNCY